MPSVPSSWVRGDIIIIFLEGKQSCRRGRGAYSGQGSAKRGGTWGRQPGQGVRTSRGVLHSRSAILDATGIDHSPGSIITGAFRGGS